METLIPDSSTRALPNDCAFAVAVPLTRQEFERDLASREQKDFASNWMQQFDGLSTSLAWNSYRPYADLIEDVARQAKGWGVEVNHRASLVEWAGMLRRRRIVTLVAHCKRVDEAGAGDQLEFGDGLHPIPDVLAAMPEAYAGTLDLSVCFSLDLAGPLKRKFPACSVIANKRKARLDYRLAIYRQVLRRLRTGCCSYVEAMTEVQLAVLKSAKLAARAAGG